MESLEEPRTGGGLRSRQFDAEEYFFGGRRPPRVQQQYIGFAEDMMLILFLVCILATLVTVHRAACYRSIQDARRNTPLRHILPLGKTKFSERLKKYVLVRVKLYKCTEKHFLNEICHKFLPID